MGRDAAHANGTPHSVRSAAHSPHGGTRKQPRALGEHATTLQHPGPPGSAAEGSPCPLTDLLLWGGLGCSRASPGADQLGVHRPGPGAVWAPEVPRGAGPEHRRPSRAGGDMDRPPAPRVEDPGGAHVPGVPTGHQSPRGGRWGRAGEGAGAEGSARGGQRPPPGTPGGVSGKRHRVRGEAQGAGPTGAPSSRDPCGPHPTATRTPLGPASTRQRTRRAPSPPRTPQAGLPRGPRPRDPGRPALAPGRPERCC